MRRLINYIRSCFCKHEWQYEQYDQVKIHRPAWESYCIGEAAKPEPIITGVIVSATCKKCGWHRSYSKFRKD